MKQHPPMDRRTFLQHTQHAATAVALGSTAAWFPALAWGQSGPPASEAKAPPLPAEGTVLKLPAITRLDGSVFTPEQARGKVLVLYWWASTCPFCALQSPEMQKLWAQHKGRGMELLALSVDRKKEDAVPYLQKRGYTFPAAWVTPEFQAALPKPRGLPITLVLGRDGRVLQADKGQMFAEDVEQLARFWG
jgi:thiol-disulfide isomerase/thioredoxin